MRDDGTGNPAALSPDGKHVATASQGRVDLWSATDGKWLRTLRREGPLVRQLAFAPDGKGLAAGQVDGTVKFWQVPSGRVGPVLRWPEKTLALFAGTLQFTPDGTALGITDGFGHLCLWDVKTGKVLWRSRETLCYPTIFSPDGKTLLVGNASRGVTMLDAGTGKELTSLPVQPFTNRTLPGSTVHALALSPDGRWLAAGLDEGQVAIYDMHRRREIRRFQAVEAFPAHPIRTVRTVAFSPDGWWLATCADPVRLCQATSLLPPSGDTNLSSATPRLSSRYSFPATSLPHSLREFAAKEYDPCLPPPLRLPSPLHWEDGKYGSRISGKGPVLLHLWEVTTGKEVHRWEGHKRAIRQVEFTPDGRTVFSSDCDGQAYLWGLQPTVPDKQDLKLLWDDLRSADAKKAYTATWALLAEPKASVSLLRRKLGPLPATEQDRVCRLITGLDSEQETVRRSAKRALEDVGDPGIPALEAALSRASPQARKPLTELLDASAKHSATAQLRVRRALHVLEMMGTPEAVDLLRRLAESLPDARLQEYAKAAGKRLAGRR